MFGSALLTGSSYWPGTFATSVGSSCVAAEPVGASTSQSPAGRRTVVVSGEAAGSTSRRITGAGGDTLEIQSDGENDSSGEDPAAARQDDATGKEDSQGASHGTSTTGEPLTKEEQATVRNLQKIDRAVRSHEQAHLAAAGGYARGGARFQTTRGPDGKSYAVGGEVSIDASPVRDNPQATIRKAQVVRAAALAPADPSSQDRAVAAAASQMEIQARAEFATQRREEQQGDAESDSDCETGSDSDSTVSPGDPAMGSGGDTDNHSDAASLGHPLDLVA